MTRSVCVHGHFYQPPRENPWLETIEVQDSAYPFHDWNQRIMAECYAPNAASRILDDEGLVTQIVNNYSRISFNFGPTLLSWLQAEAPEVYAAILEADRQSIERFSGHGSAMAQAYNHVIMPLANPRDKTTQILWGLRDFEFRFGRKPEGMWLPEAAVDTETLDMLAERGVKFTVLAPRQAGRVRMIGSREWHETASESVDPRRPYLQTLPSGREIVLFFYDGDISKDVAFNQLLEDGSRLAGRLLDAFDDQAAEDQLVHIATDGETYGHHHRFGDMALASALQHIEELEDTELTVYGEYLESHPPEWEVEIVENSSWSCVHGVERWRNNCGCNSGGHPGWHQEWRAPLRNALDWLRDELNIKYEEESARFFPDPWSARDGYINVVLDRASDSINQFMTAYSGPDIPVDGDRVHALKLLEMQRHLMLMYTSCGWFFDELSGIETVQVIEYAGRAVQLAADLFGPEARDGFVTRLGEAKSNLPAHRDGEAIFEKWVAPGAINLPAVAAHVAISELFTKNGDETGSNLSAYEVGHTAPPIFREMGRARFTAGSVGIESRITTESDGFHFAALHLGDQNVTCGISPAIDGKSPDEWASEFLAVADEGDTPGLIRAFDSAFGTGQYSLRSLFRDEQRRILNLILESATQGAEGAYQTLYEQQLPVMRFLVDMGSPIPQAFRTAAEYFMNSVIRRELERTDSQLDCEWLKQRLDEADYLQIDLDSRGLGLLLEHDIHSMLQEFRGGIAEVGDLQRLKDAVDIARNSKLSVDLWDAQNTVYEIARGEYLQAVKEAKAGSEEKHTWAELFRELASHVSVGVPAL